MMKRVKDIARELACSQETVRRMLKAGKIPGVKVGRDWRADPEKVLLALSNKPASSLPKATQGN